MTDKEEIEWLETYQRELQSVGNDLHKSVKARLRKLKIKENKGRHLAKKRLDEFEAQLAKEAN